MAKEWYVVKIYSGQDKKIKQVIENELELQSLDSRVEEVVVPMETVTEVKGGKKKQRTKVFFPGYVLLKMDLDLKLKHCILNTPGIMNFVGPNNEPQILRESEVNRILKRVDDSKAEPKEQTKIEVPYKVGDSVRVIDGPFNEFKGNVEEIDEAKQKVKVMVSIFGRSTPVELDFTQIELEGEN